MPVNTIIAFMGRKKPRNQRLTKEQQKEKTRQLLRYLSPLLWAFATWFLLITLIHAPFIKNPVQVAFVNFTTNSAYYLGRLFLLPVEMPEMPILRVNGFAMQVVMECTAYNFYLFGIVLTLFARWPARHKLISLGIFLLFIFIFNNLRFISMGYLGSFRPDLFDVVHDTVWNVLFGFFVFGIWVWREIAARRMIKSREATA